MNVIPKNIQHQYNKRMNVCTNCHWFKLDRVFCKDYMKNMPRPIGLKPVVDKIWKYEGLVARCTNEEAKSEYYPREKAIALQRLAVKYDAIPGLRKKCKYFYLDV